MNDTTPTEAPYRAAPIIPSPIRRTRWRLAVRDESVTYVYMTVAAGLLAFNCAGKFIIEGATPYVLRVAAVTALAFVLWGAAYLRVEREESRL